MPVFAFGSPKDKITMWHWQGEDGGKKKTNTENLKITLKFSTVPNDALDCRCQRFCFRRDTDEAQLDPSMLHVLESQAGFLECLLLPELAGAAVPYGRGTRVLARPGRGSQPLVSMGSTRHTFPGSRESCLIYRVLFGGKERLHYSLFLSLCPSLFALNFKIVI